MEVIREYREREGSIAAVFPIHYSRALLRAFDILPVEVWVPPRESSNLGEAHFQPYICSIVRNAFSFLQSGGLDVADLLFLPHACDSLQGLGSILIDFASPRQPVLTLYIPRGRRKSDVVFLANEFRAVYRRLEKITGRSPSDAILMACIQREEGADRLLLELRSQRQSIPLDDIAYYRLIRSREYLPAESFALLAQDVLSKVAKIDLRRIPIILSGIVPEPMSLFRSISEMGGLVAADDLASCGRRLYPTGQSEDPFNRMAEQIVFAPPDPTRGSPINERLDYLLRLVRNTSARGVVFYDVKFCEPELFDLPQLRQGLRNCGISSLTVEVDLNDELTQPVLNRLAAFLEMLQ
jgi:benzoyl-CoA reductase/2-hydroxyglutaryl-CoA dehydratase subunit BcrC/BadD/HgdB